MSFERFGKHWTPDEDLYLEGAWHARSISTIMIRLKRPDKSIIDRAWRLGLGPRQNYRENLEVLSARLGYYPRTIVALAKRHSIRLGRYRKGKPGSRYLISLDTANRLEQLLDDLGWPIKPLDPGLPITCLDCGEVKKAAGRGLCLRCYNRHYRHGTLDLYPAKLKRADGETVAA